MLNKSTHWFIRSALVLTLVVFALSALAAPALAQRPKPAPPIGATQIPSSPENDKLVADLAKSLGLTDTAYEAWQLPANSVWDDTFKYYADQMSQAGWSGQGVTQDFSGGKVGVWLSTDTKTALVIFYLAGSGTSPAYDLAIFGTVAASTAAAPPAAAPKSSSIGKPAAPQGAKQVTGTADWDKLVADLAKSIGWTDYAYEAWQLPATATWDDTFKYYNDQLVQAGWNGQGVTQDFSGGKVGVWISAETKSGVVVVFVPSPDGVQPAYDLALIGK